MAVFVSSMPGLLAVMAQPVAITISMDSTTETDYRDAPDQTARSGSVAITILWRITVSSVSTDVNSAITDAQQAVIDAIEQKMNDQFSALLDGTFSTMSLPSGVYYGIQAGANNYYNKNFLDQINQQVQVASNGLLEAEGALFTSMYADIMSAVVFVFGDADNKLLNADLAKADAQVQTVINSWEGDMGPITSDEIATAVPKSKLGYIQAQVQSLWKGDPTKIPTSMQDFKSAYQSFQVAAQVANRLTLQSATAMNRLTGNPGVSGGVRTNISSPSAANGGLQTASSSWYPAFGPFPTQNAIIDSIQSTDRTVTITFSVNNFSSESSTFKVDESIGFTVPIEDVAEIGFKSTSSYSLDRYTSSTTSLQMTCTYPGVTFISCPLTAGALTTDNSQGWYAGDILQQAISNTDGSQTGYSLQGQFPADTYFGPGKQFSRVKTLVVSNEPSISMQFCDGDTTNIMSDFKVGGSVSLKLLDLFKVGSVSSNYEVTNVDDHSVAGCVTVTLGPPNSSSGTTNLADARAYLLGGVASYPPNNT